MKKVLFLTYDFPYPTTSGGKLRAYNLPKYRGDFSVSLFSFTRQEVSEEVKRKLKEDLKLEELYCVKRVPLSFFTKISSITDWRASIFKKLYFDTKVLKKIKQIISENSIDILHCESFYTAFYINEELKDTGVKTVFGTENIEYLLYKEYVQENVGLLARPFFNREVGKIKREESKLFKSADSIISVSKTEAEFIHDLVGRRAFIVENGIDTQLFSYKKKRKTALTNLIFVGNFIYFPNREALQYIYNQILPLLNQEKYTFTVVGKNAGMLKKPKFANLQIIDFVKDIETVYDSGDVFIFPVKKGGGTNFKLLEAMATGVPIVGFPDRIVELGARDRVHFLSANNPEEFKQKVEEITREVKLRDRITENARRLIEKNYSWKSIGKKLELVWQSL